MCLYVSFSSLPPSRLPPLPTNLPPARPFFNGTPPPSPLEGPRLLVNPVRLEHPLLRVDEGRGVNRQPLLELVDGGAVRVYGCVLIAFEHSGAGITHTSIDT